MDAKDKRVVKRLAKNLQKYNELVADLSDEGWSELVEKLDQEECPIVWREFENFVKSLSAVAQSV